MLNTYKVNMPCRGCR